MSSNSLSYMNFWGKADDKRWHPLVYHMLDVAGSLSNTIVEEGISIYERPGS